MYRHSRPQNNGTTVAKVVCAIVFVAFSFLWLYVFQADILAVTQHRLSKGQTHYDPLWGALIITAILWLLQWGVNWAVRLNGRTHALTWMPSMLVLAVLTSYSTDSGSPFPSAYWLWLAPVLLLLWVLGVWVARAIQPFERDASRKPVARNLWGNLLLAALLITVVAATSNTNAVGHFRAHAETALLRGDNAEALQAGRRSLETDASLMMLRMYALSRQGQLADRLFEYPLVASSEAMLPTTRAVSLLLYPADSLYRHLGAIPRKTMRPMDYLRAIIRSGQAKAAAVDYLLCGYLIDRRLDTFARALKQYYTEGDSLPRYYREALILYNHRHSQPVMVYHDPVLDEDYEDFRKTENQHPQVNERKGKLLETYADSYWFYYDYNTTEP